MSHKLSVFPLLFALFLGLLSFDTTDSFTPAPKQKLSDYGFFTGALASLTPADNVFPYDVNAPLFSDYAEKARFIALPKGTKMQFQPDAAFEFPVGAAIIKHFYYSHEQAHPEKGRRILETRLLLREEKGWKALEYLWNAEQTDATLEVAGAAFPMEWIAADGKKMAIEYIAPNLNQCKGCHSLDGKFVALGVNARQLNRPAASGENAPNQLVGWYEKGWLDLPDGYEPSEAPKLANYLDAHNTDVNAKARAYLDANCAHCHNAHGPASTSGLFLDIFENDPSRLGVNKPPVAAGRATKDLKYSIVPGKPHESILLARMISDDPGVRMPELGRQLAHREGIEVIKTWIKEMK